MNNMDYLYTFDVTLYFIDLIVATLKTYTVTRFKKSSAIKLLYI